MLCHLTNSFFVFVFVFFFFYRFSFPLSPIFVRKYLANNSFLFLFNLFYIVLSSLASSLDRLDECRLSPLSSLQQASFNSPGAMDLRMHIATSTSISLSYDTHHFRKCSIFLNEFSYNPILSNPIHSPYIQNLTLHMLRLQYTKKPSGIFSICG